MQSVLRNEIKIFSIIILVGILLYAHHLHHPFQFDSLGAIKENPRLNDPTQLFSLEFFVQEYFDRGLLQMSLALNATSGWCQFLWLSFGQSVDPSDQFHSCLLRYLAHAGNFFRPGPYHQ